MLTALPNRLKPVYGLFGRSNRLVDNVNSNFKARLDKVRTINSELNGLVRPLRLIDRLDEPLSEYGKINFEQIIEIFLKFFVEKYFYHWYFLKTSIFSTT